MRARKIGLTLILMTFSFSVLAQAGPERRARGWVRGLKAGDAAVMKLTGAATRQTSSRPGGAWEIRGLAPGTYFVTPHSPEYRFDPPQRTIKVSGADLNAINFTAISTSPAIEPKATGGADAVALSIRGRVTGLKSGERVVVRARGPEALETMTGPGGKYVLPVSQSGLYVVVIEDARYKLRPAARDVKVAARPKRNINFKASRKAGVRVVAKSALPVSKYFLRGQVKGLKYLLGGCKRAQVQAVGPVTKKAYTMDSDSPTVCGTFIFRDLPEGKYTIKVTIRSDATSTWRISPRSKEVVLQKDLTGIVFEADEKNRQKRRKRRGGF